MITKEEMFTPILAACPAFQAEWELFLEERQDTSEGSPYYLALSELARHLIGLLERNETEAIGAVFRVVEDWHLKGDQFVREAATVGLLEDLQNTNLHQGGTKPDDFLPYILPETKFWWLKVVDFWEQGKLITDDRPKH